MRTATKSLKLCVLFIFVCISAVTATDLLDLRVYPCYERQKMFIEGAICKNFHKNKGTSIYARTISHKPIWMKSGFVRVSVEGKSYSAVVKDGIFRLKVPYTNNSGLLKVSYKGKKLTTEKYNFPQNVDFVVLSDIDDTILVSHITKKFKKLYYALVKKVSKRKAVDGTPKLYQDFASQSALGNPFFIYLSGSSAALSRPIKKFMADKKFPHGSIILRKSFFGVSSEHHKFEWLKKLVKLYPDKPMVLLGDSGEKDPFIYTSFANDYPEKVKAIVIHEVTNSSSRIEALNAFKTRMAEIGIPFIFWNDKSKLRETLIKENILK